MRPTRFLRIAFCLLALSAGPVLAQETAPSLTDLQQAAADSDVTAQYELGLRYHSGDGVTKDFATAAEWFTKAAQAGHAPAQNYLGRYYFEGLGVAQDPAQALVLLEQAAGAGDAQFVFDFALALEAAADTAGRAATLYLQAAEQGHVEAAVNLSVLLQEGRGVAQDFGQARQLLEAAAQAGNVRALNNLGLLYVRGNGVAQDYQRASELFSAAAEGGLRSAMRNLGVLYENGFGVPLDEAKAAELYRMAGGGSAGASAEESVTQFVYDGRLQPVETTNAALTALGTAAQAGDPIAQFQVAWLLVSSEAPSFADFRQAKALFEAAANRGYGPAMVNLATLYFEGLGGPQDYMLGHMWLVLAEASGQESQARQMQGRFSARLVASQINEAQQRAAALTDSLRLQP